MNNPWKRSSEREPEEYIKYLIWFPNGLETVGWYIKEEKKWSIFINEKENIKVSIENTFFMKIPKLPKGW